MRRDLDKGTAGPGQKSIYGLEVYDGRSRRDSRSFLPYSNLTLHRLRNLLNSKPPSIVYRQDSRSEI